MEAKHKKFWAAAEAVQKFYDRPLYDAYVVDKSEFPLHYRFKTAAFACEDNCQPFMSILWRPSKSTIAHELAHVQDYALIGEKLNEAGQKVPVLVEKLYTEGRGLFIGAKAGSRAFPALLYTSLFGSLFEATLLAIFTVSMFVPPLSRAIASFLQPLKPIVGNIPLLHTGSATFWAAFWAFLISSVPVNYWATGNSLEYLPFYRSLRRIEREVGDAATAYKITSEKIPLTLHDILSPLEFYKDEIAAAKAKKNEASSS